MIPEAIEKWNPLEAPAIASVVDYFNVMLQTTFPVTVAAFQLFFMVDAAIVLGLMQHFFPEKASDPLFPSMMRPIEFLVLSVYTIFLQSQMGGYTDPVQAYFRMLQDVCGLAPLLRPLKIDDCCGILKRQVDWVGQINRPGTGSPKEARTRYEFSLAKLLDEIDESENPLVYAKIVANLESLRGIELSQSIQSPDLMRTYILTFLSLWFGIWFPISMWAVLGFKTTLALYPTFMYVLTGPGIGKFWLGSPWDNERVFRESNHILWPEQFKAKIDRSFNPL